jgi:hypothetical protein
MPQLQLSFFPFGVTEIQTSGVVSPNPRNFQNAWSDGFVLVKYSSHFPRIDDEYAGRLIGSRVA